MKQILVYADSLSWGIVPLTRSRLGFEQHARLGRAIAEVVAAALPGGADRRPS